MTKPSPLTPAEIREVGDPAVPLTSAEQIDAAYDREHYWALQGPEAINREQAAIVRRWEARREARLQAARLQAEQAARQARGDRPEPWATPTRPAPTPRSTARPAPLPVGPPRGPASPRRQPSPFLRRGAGTKEIPVDSTKEVA